MATYTYENYTLILPDPFANILANKYAICGAPTLYTPHAAYQIDQRNLKWRRFTYSEQPPVDSYLRLTTDGELIPHSPPSEEPTLEESLFIVDENPPYDIESFAVFQYSTREVLTELGLLGTDTITTGNPQSITAVGHASQYRLHAAAQAYSNPLRPAAQDLAILLRELINLENSSKITSRYPPIWRALVWGYGDERLAAAFLLKHGFLPTTTEKMDFPSLHTIKRAANGITISFTPITKTFLQQQIYMATTTITMLYNELPKKAIGALPHLFSKGSSTLFFTRKENTFLSLPSGLTTEIKGILRSFAQNLILQRQYDIEPHIDKVFSSFEHVFNVPHDDIYLPYDQLLTRVRRTENNSAGGLARTATSAHETFIATLFEKNALDGTYSPRVPYAHSIPFTFYRKSILAVAHKSFIDKWKKRGWLQEYATEGRQIIYQIPPEFTPGGEELTF